MRISLLIKREPFGEILEYTLKKFLESRLGKSFDIKWHSSVRSRERRSSSQLWLCNPYLNAIFVPSVAKQNLLPVINEFSRSPVWWKRPFQKVYVDLAVSKKGRRYFSNMGLEISPGIERSEDILILGGNNHIRLLDYNYEKAYVIIKDGFDSRLLKNDIMVRTQHPYLPAPSIQDIDVGRSWYSEELIVGTPVNRLENQADALHVLNSVCDSLFRLYKDTVQSVNTDKYTEKLVREIKGHLKKNIFLGQNEKDELLTVASKLQAIINNSEGSGDKTMVAQTHGDFQPANILLGKDRSWLIDWEYTGTRQVAYDGLVFALSSRSSGGLSKRVSKILRDELPEARQILSEWPYIDWTEKDMRPPILSLFFLEELLLKLKENSVARLSCPGHGLSIFCNEVKNSAKMFKNLC